MHRNMADARINDDELLVYNELQLKGLYWDLKKKRIAPSRKMPCWKGKKVQGELFE